MAPNASRSRVISKLPTIASSDSSGRVVRRSFKCVDVHCNKVFKDKLSYENHVQIRHGGLLKTHLQSVAQVLGSLSNGESSVVRPPSPNDISALKASLDHVDNLIVRQHEPPNDTAGFNPDPQDVICASLDERPLLSASIASKEHSSQKVNSCEYDGRGTEVDQETIFHEQTASDLLDGSPGPEAQLEHLEVDQQSAFEVRPQLQRQGSAAAETYQFFKSCNDGCEDVFEGLGNLSPPWESLSKSSQAVLKFCSKKCMTLGESRELFELVTELERLSFMNEGDHRTKQPLASDFETGKTFSAYLRSARRRSVAQENWKTAVIRSSFGLNKTGVFRCVLGVMLEKIKEQGGVKSIIDFQIETKDGDRIYSAPWNSEVMHDYQRNLPRPGKIVLFDVYSDGTCLSNSGTQSANLMRVRFSNIRGITDKWHEVGIVPTVQTYGHSASSSQLRKEKNSLWHRFAFVGFEALIRKSRLGMMIEGVEVFPRLGMIVADQVQERPTFGLKGHDSFFDCTHCLMPSKDSLNLRGQEEVNKKRKSSPSRGDDDSMDSSQRTWESIDSGQSTSEVRTPGGHFISQTVVETEKSTGRVKSLQLGTGSYPRRDVFTTVKKQLKLAKKSSKPTPAVVNDNGKRYAPQRYEIKEAQNYLRAVSANDFPPAFAAIEGAGSFPYRLYSSIGFDKLHAWEHGVSRMLTDDAFKIFESSPPYNGYSKARVVNIANQRIADLPRSAQLKRFPAYRKNGNESHAGVTGKMRRDLLCFLWVSVMGIPKTVPPDDDEFLQLLLTADLFQRKLMGINSNSSSAKRTFSEIQEIAKLGFEVGTRVASLFRCAVNTKIHRVMRHILDHFVDFGCIRKGSTDDNETQHKVTKKGYKSTNKHASKIAPQLLAARASVSATDVDESDLYSGSVNVSTGVAQLLLTRDLSASAPKTVVTEDDYESDIITIAENEVEVVKQMKSAVENTSCIEEAEKAISSQTHVTSNELVWKSVKSARFMATLPWSSETHVHQTVYAGEDIFKYRRRDAVSYSIGGITYTGVLQAMFSHHRNASHRVALIRRLERIPAELRNRNIVEKFGNVRFGYQMDGSDVKKDCVPISRFIRKVMLIPDPWLVSKLYGADMRLSKLPDDKHSRRVQAFFEVAGYQFSSHREQLCDTEK